MYSITTKMSSELETLHCRHKSDLCQIICADVLDNGKHDDNDSQ